MDRNLSRRVEVVFPVEPPELKQRLIKEVLATCLADNTKSRELLPDGSYRRIKGESPLRSQERFLEIAAQNALRRLPEVQQPAPPAPAARTGRLRSSRKRQTRA
jgi:polyphosphate kinase